MPEPAAPHAPLAVTIYYEDTDASGVVYHANYLRYFERARTVWMNATGLSHRRLADDPGIAFTLADAALVFHAPARLDDRLQVYTRVAERRRVRLVFEQDIFCGDRLLVKGKFTVVCVRICDFRPARLPEVLSKELE